MNSHLSLTLDPMALYPQSTRANLEWHKGLSNFSHTQAWPPKVMPNVLYWPWSASRWAVGFFLVRDDQLRLIRQRVYTGSGFTSQTLRIQDEPQIALSPQGFGRVEAGMFLLPPYPLAQIIKDSALWLMPLVDERFFWWEYSAEITVEEDDTWGILEAAIAAALGISISGDGADPDYVTPPKDLTSRHQYLPPLLDATAFSTGRRLVRHFDGAVELLKPATALTRRTINRNRIKQPKTAGGKMALDRNLV